MQATQTYRITPKQHTLTTLTENTHTGTPHINRAPTLQAGQTQHPTQTHTGTHAHTPTGHSPNIPLDGHHHSLRTPAQTRSQTHAHTQARHLQIHNPAHARSHGGARRPPALSQPPHPAAATCARPARQASAGPITGCCWGAAPARRSRRLRGPRAAPCHRPQRARAWGVAAPPCRTPPHPSRTAGAGAVGVDSLPRALTGRQGALPSPHPIVCKQTRQTAEAPALQDP